MNNLWRIILAVLLAGVAESQLAAQSTFSTIISNGPPAKRFNVVFLSEGYTLAQLALFRSDATNAMNALLAREPWNSYRPYCNGFAISVASATSGSSHYGATPTTYFNSAYDSSDRIITIPSGSTGQGKVDALITQWLPDCDLAVLLVNDIVDGGSEGAGKTAIAARLSYYILIHEIGHVQANLGDEYTTPYPGFPDIEEPNTTTNASQIKWAAWIDPTTPLPTPADTDFDGVIGLFEGAHYHTTGWYRPKLNCTMQSQYTTEFCEVCREALLLSLCKPVKRIVASTPASNSVSITNASLQSFSVSLLDPASHALQVQWFTNKVAVTLATNRAFTLDPTQLPNGTNTVSAMAFDPTDFVRTDPSRVRWETNSWTLSLNFLRATPATLSNVKYVSNRLSFTIQGTAPQGYVVEGSTNLLSWRGVQTNGFLNGSVQFTNSAGDPNQWYRVRNL